MRTIFFSPTKIFSGVIKFQRCLREDLIVADKHVWLMCMQLCCRARIAWKSPRGRFERRNQTHDLHNRKFIFTALSYKKRNKNDLLFIQSQATSELYNLLVQSDNLDHLFPCPNVKVTRLGCSDGPSFSAFPWETTWRHLNLCKDGWYREQGLFPRKAFSLSVGLCSSSFTVLSICFLCTFY